MRNKSWLALLLAFAASSLVLAGCSSDDNGSDVGIVDPGPDSIATCEGCHTSEAMLKATVEPEEEAPESEGEG